MSALQACQDLRLLRTMLRICRDTKESAFIIWMKDRRMPGRYFFACTANQRGAISIGK